MNSADVGDSVGLEGASVESELLFTPPASTTVGQQDDDIEIEIARRRWNLAQSLLVEGKYEAAVPHLRRVLLDIEGHRIRSDRWNQSDIQFLLAKTMMETSSRNKANALFKAVYESRDSKPLKRASAAHFLASSIFENVGVQNNDLEEAKSFCMYSIQTRKKHLGCDDAAIRSSIALIRDICQFMDDPDWDIWNSMLPKGFQLSAPVCRNTVISTFPASIAAARVTMQGKLLSYSSEGAQSIVRLFDTNTWKVVGEVKLRGSVAAATVSSQRILSHYHYRASSKYSRRHPSYAKLLV
jgi:hypothetical protein